MKRLYLWTDNGNEAFRRKQPVHTIPVDVIVSAADLDNLDELAGPVGQALAESLRQNAPELKQQALQAGGINVP